MTNQAEGSTPGSVPGEELILNFNPLENSRNPIFLDMQPLAMPADVHSIDQCEHYLSRNDKGCIIINTATIPVLDFDYNSNWQKRMTKNEFESFLFAEIEKLTSNYRLYRTAAGYRAVLTDKLVPVQNFDFFPWEQMGGDVVYNMFCRSAGAYRVRLTPKPVRIGMRELSAVFNKENLANMELITDEEERVYQQWLKDYAHASNNFAVCSLLRHKSTEPTPQIINRFLELHDSATRAHLALHLA